MKAYRAQFFKYLGEGTVRSAQRPGYGRDARGIARRSPTEVKNVTSY